MGDGPALRSEPTALNITTHLRRTEWTGRPTRDDLGVPWCDCDFWFRRSKDKVSRAINMCA